MIDCHVHSDFSPDSGTPAETTVLSAIAKGVTVLTFTDHLDCSKTGKVPERMRDLSVYFNTISDLKEKYRGRISIAVGIELGWSKSFENLIAEMVAPFPFDYIINSIHDVSGEDVYKQSYFKTRGKHKAFADYFDAVLLSLDAVYPYDAVGHLCYPERVAPYDDPSVTVEEFRPELNAIFNKIIKKKKILELNTSTKNLSTPCIPRESVLKYYKDLNGTKITFASDAHDTDRICDKYNDVAVLCKKIGFDRFTYKLNNQEKTEKI